MDMKKLFAACFLLVMVSLLQSKVFASSKNLNCQFSNDEVVEGVTSIEISNETLMINKDLEIPLEKSTIRCGNFGRQRRFDGLALGYQIVLESCTTGVALKGDLIDSVKGISAKVICNHVQ
jgi:hypothetical protein